MEFYKFTKLDDANGDLSKRWKAYYSFINPNTYKFEQHQEYISSGLKIKNVSCRKFE